MQFFNRKDKNKVVMDLDTALFARYALYRLSKEYESKAAKFGNYDDDQYFLKMYDKAHKAWRDLVFITEAKSFAESLDK